MGVGSTVMPDASITDHECDGNAANGDPTQKVDLMGDREVVEDRLHSLLVEGLLST